MPDQNFTPPQEPNNQPEQSVNPQPQASPTFQQPQGNPNPVQPLNTPQLQQLDNNPINQSQPKINEYNYINSEDNIDNNIPERGKYLNFILILFTTLIIVSLWIINVLFFSTNNILLTISDILWVIVLPLTYLIFVWVKRYRTLRIIESILFLLSIGVGSLIIISAIGYEPTDMGSLGVIFVFSLLIDYFIALAPVLFIVPVLIKIFSRKESFLPIKNKTVKAIIISFVLVITVGLSVYLVVLPWIRIGVATNTTSVDIGEDKSLLKYEDSIRKANDYFYPDTEISYIKTAASSTMQNDNIIFSVVVRLKNKGLDNIYFSYPVTMDHYSTTGQFGDQYTTSNLRSGSENYEYFMQTYDVDGHKWTINEYATSPEKTLDDRILRDYDAIEEDLREAFSYISNKKGNITIINTSILEPTDSGYVLRTTKELHILFEDYKSNLGTDNAKTMIFLYDKKDNSWVEKDTSTSSL